MRMVFADHVADHTRRFHRFGAGPQPQLAHGIEYAPLHGFLAVPDIGQRAALDHGDGVLQIIARGGLVQKNTAVILVDGRRGGNGKHVRGSLVFLAMLHFIKTDSGWKPPPSGGWG